MKQFLQFSKLLIIILLITLIGCSSDDTTEPVVNDEISAEDFSFKVEPYQVQPKLQAAYDSGNLGALRVMQVINIYNSMGEYNSQVLPPNGSVMSKVLHQATIDGVTVKWESLKFADYIELEMTYNGTRGTDGMVFSNFLKGQMIAFTDGSYFQQEVFEDNTETPFMAIEITEHSNNDLVCNFFLAHVMNSTITHSTNGEMEIVDIMEDGSYWEATVFGDGTGMYRYFNPDGTIIQEEAWN